MKSRWILFLLCCCWLRPSVWADSLTYANAGHVAQEMLTYATSSGGITAYYMGSTAGFEDQIEVADVQTGYRSGKVLDNKTTSPGTSFTIGTAPGQINAGDQLVFYIDSPDGSFASLASDSPDGINHAYFAEYNGGSVNNQNIPAGTFVGMEDLPFGISDLNYNDDDFVFTGLTTADVTPEPASALLFATGVGIFFWLKRKRRVPIS